MAEALDHAHQAGIVHRDVKPENIMVTADEGQAKLCDLGLARGTGEESRLTQAGAAIGSSRSYSGLNQTTRKNIRLRMPVISTAAIRMPKNFPRMNCRRDTGLLISVTAVRPSISSLIDMLAASTAKRPAKSMMVSYPNSFTILRSSPKVK